MVSEEQDAYRVILEQLDANESGASCKDAEIAVGTARTDFIEEG